jgi:hypothetical protein
MFDGSSVVSEIECPAWDAARASSRVDWRRVDRELRAIAKKRAALDAEEARWLREAERMQIWRRLGMVSALDYMERALGYTPHTARERLRVAKALAELPAIGESFADGELSYSAVRELTRVAISDTDVEWRDHAVGKTVREIEDVVATHALGSRPSDPADPAIRPRVLRLELRPDTYARFRQVRTMLSDEKQRHLDDDELIAALCDIALDPAPSSGESHGRAKYQVSMTVCSRCKQGWQQAAAPRSPSTRLQSSEHCATDSTSGRSMATGPNAHIRTFHPHSGASSGTAMVVAARLPAVAALGTSRSTTSSPSPTAVSTSLRIARSAVDRATTRITTAG